ncbi:MAG: PEP-utilizing enzyme [Desulfobulbaceae bacterium]|nr:PEP-utilizing enzyme [Desulfobulbaceae bacterium]
MFNHFDLFRKSKISRRISPNKEAFHQKYETFKRALAGNNRALEIITDLENLFYADKPFSLDYVLQQTEILVGEIYNIVKDVNGLSGGKYPALFDAVEEIGANILAGLEKRKRIEKTCLIIPLENLSRESAAEVGGKAANLGEVFNRVNLPVPYGFAISAYACQQFIDYTEVCAKTIDSRIRGLDIDDTEELTRASEEIQATIMKIPLPPDLENAITQVASRLHREFGPELRLSVRSSATSEDSEASFAGQHATVLNVSLEDLIPAYKEVVASTFSPRAIFYRRKKGYLDQDVVMSVFCMVMINARSAGIMYTTDPNDNRHHVLMISAVWGLGEGAVDGSSNTDFYQISKENKNIELSHVASKKTQLVSCANGGIRAEPVPEDLRERACLNEAQIRKLAEYGLTLEKHYGLPLDIEWAVDQNERIFILQARPLRRPVRAREEPNLPLVPAELSDHPVLLQGGATACEGTASGLAYVLRSDHNLAGIPAGAILITQQTSPRYVPALGRIKGIITDVGSVTGHMASVAREFNIPTLVGTGSATSLIRHGEEITLDAKNRAVYQGRVERLLQTIPPVNPMKGSPTYHAVANALKKIAPLNLIDPKDPNFRREGCKTIHDIIRLAHELSMQEMFRIGDEFKFEKGIALRLRTNLPLSIYVINLEGGLSADSEQARIVTEEDIISVPFRSLLRGMTHQGVQWTGPAAVDWRGFGAILMESFLRNPQMEKKMATPSYAIISREYLNFNCRLGYHFTTVHAYCGPVINDNYITFFFKGGAADITRRTRRAQLIGRVLKKMNFKIELKADMISGTLKKFDCALIQEKLDILGRLFGAVRMMDMVLSDDQQIDWYVDEFFKGNYSFAAHD